MEATRPPAAPRAAPVSAAAQRDRAAAARGARLLEYAGGDAHAVLRDLQGLCEELPVLLPGSVAFQGSAPLGSGSFGIVDAVRVVPAAASSPAERDDNGTSAPLAAAVARVCESGVAYARKLLAPQSPTARDPDAGIRCLVTEACCLMQASHPNVIKLLGLGALDEEPESLYMLQELLPGDCLSDLVGAGAASAAGNSSRRSSRGGGAPPVPPLPADEAILRLKWALGLARALDYLHQELRVVHRDVKLSNVKLSSKDTAEAEAVLLDLGLACERLPDHIAKLSDDSTKLIVRRRAPRRSYSATETRNLPCDVHALQGVLAYNPQISSDEGSPPKLCSAKSAPDFASAPDLSEIQQRGTFIPRTATDDGFGPEGSQWPSWDDGPDSTGDDQPARTSHASKECENSSSYENLAEQSSTPSDYLPSRLGICRVSPGGPAVTSSAQGLTPMARARRPSASQQNRAQQAAVSKNPYARLLHDGIESVPRLADDPDSLLLARRASFSGGPSNRKSMDTEDNVLECCKKLSSRRASHADVPLAIPNVRPKIQRSSDSGFKVQRSSDSGCTRKEHATLSRNDVGGTPLYMAPEVKSRSTVYDTAVDVYGFGLCLYEIIHDSTLPEVAKAFHLYGSAVAGALRKGWRPSIASTRCDEAVGTLIRQCWRSNPSERPKMEEAVRVLAAALEAAEQEQRLQPQEQPKPLAPSLSSKISRLSPQFSATRTDGNEMRSRRRSWIGNCFAPQVAC